VVRKRERKPQEPKRNPTCLSNCFSCGEKLWLCRGNRRGVKGGKGEESGIGRAIVSLRFERGRGAGTMEGGKKTLPPL